jgi:uncharacterized protein YdbL (DUF1318 family)
MLILDICLSDLPSEAITTAKNGKKYIKLVCAERKAEGKFGETHYIALSQTKEEREAKKPATYVGGAKNVSYKNVTSAKNSIADVVKDEYANSKFNENSDLPF